MEEKKEEILEDILEEFKADAKEVSKEKKEIDNEIEAFDDIEFKDNSRVTNFLMNPWKRNSFVGDNPISNLEEDLEEETTLEKDEDKKNDEFNYMKKEEGEEEGFYKKPKMEVNYDRVKSPEEFKAQDKRDIFRDDKANKKMYDRIQKMQGLETSKDDIRYVTVEDTLKKDYLNKVKFRT